MKLPKLEQPIFTVTLPSNKQKIKLRPMLVKEEKILLMSKESEDNNSILEAVKQIVNNCLVNSDINVNNLTTFDIDYLFIKIRANSVDSKIKLSYVDEEDEPITDKKGNVINKTYDFEIDLNDIEVKFPEQSANKVITINKDSGLKLKYPEALIYESEIIAKADSSEKIIEEIILNSFDSYFEGSKVYNFKDSTREEISEFIDNLNLKVYEQVLNFFTNLPTIFYEVKFTNTKGKEKTISLNKLTDFFIF